MVHLAKVEGPVIRTFVTFIANTSVAPTVYYVLV